MILHPFFWQLNFLKSLPVIVQPIAHNVPESFHIYRHDRESQNIGRNRSSISFVSLVSLELEFCMCRYKTYLKNFMQFLGINNPQVKRYVTCAFWWFVPFVSQLLLARFLPDNQSLTTIDDVAHVTTSLVLDGVTWPDTCRFGVTLSEIALSTFLLDSTWSLASYHPAQCQKVSTSAPNLTFQICAQHA